jgi:hypothetical protein
MNPCRDEEIMMNEPKNGGEFLRDSGSFNPHISKNVEGLSHTLTTQKTNQELKLKTSG